MDTGYSWEAVGRLTIPRYKALYRYLRKQPPVQWIAAAWMGLGQGEDKPADSYVDINDIDLPPGGLRMGGIG